MGRRKRRNKAAKQHTPLKLQNFPQRQLRQGSEWFVREVSQSSANKIYRCPGCPNDIKVNQAHIVVWRADHLFGDEHSISERRHWHKHCWRLF